MKKSKTKSVPKSIGLNCCDFGCQSIFSLLWSGSFPSKMSSFCSSSSLSPIQIIMTNQNHHGQSKSPSPIKIMMITNINHHNHAGHHDDQHQNQNPQSNRDHPARHHHDEESIKSERRANPTSLGAQPPSDFQASMRGCHT